MLGFHQSTRLQRAYLNDRRIKEAIQILEHVVAIRKKRLAEDDDERLASEHEVSRALRTAE